MGKKDQTEMFGIGLAERDANPLAVLARMRAEDGLVGFRLFQDHDSRVIDMFWPIPPVPRSF